MYQSSQELIDSFLCLCRTLVMNSHWDSALFENFADSQIAEQTLRHKDPVCHLQDP